MNNAKTPVLDMAKILSPVPGDNPAGVNMQYSELYDQIREARRSEVSIEPEGTREIKAADWKSVLELTTDALTGKTKDLQIAVWLAEAMIKQYQFAGLHDALRILIILHEHFWEHLYPLPDEDDLEARANLMAWISRQAGNAIKEIRLTSMAGGDNFHFLQWEDSKLFDIPDKSDNLGAEELYKITQLREQAALEKKITGEQWRLAKNRTSRSFYEQLDELLRLCRDEFNKLDDLMDRQYGRQTPGMGDLKKSLEEIHSLVDRLVKEKRAAEPDTAITPSGERGAAAGDTGIPFPGPDTPNPASYAGPIASREDALRRLNDIALFFRKTEPHSPVSYLVQRAVHWGQMPLSRWLEDVIKDTAVLESLRETLGLKTDGETNP